MAETKAKKLSYDEMFNSTTMFYINDSCEESLSITRILWTGSPLLQKSPKKDSSGWFR